MIPVNNDNNTREFKVPRWLKWALGIAISAYIVMVTYLGVYYYPHSRKEAKDRMDSIPAYYTDTAGRRWYTGKHVDDGDTGVFRYNDIPLPEWQKLDTLTYISEDGPWGSNASSSGRFADIIRRLNAIPKPDTSLYLKLYDDRNPHIAIHYDTTPMRLCGISWKANGDSEMIYLDSLIASKCDTCKVWNITAPDLFDSLKNLVKANGMDTGRFKR